MSNAIGYAGCALLLALACTDLHARRLPNLLVSAFSALYFAHAWAIGTTYGTLAQHAAAALVVLLCATAVFAAGGIGGGDVKLASALALWIGPQGWLAALALVSIAGLTLALIGLLADRLAALAASSPAFACTLRLVSARRGVPYGVALSACGVVALLPRSLFFG